MCYARGLGCCVISLSLKKRRSVFAIGAHNNLHLPNKLPHTKCKSHAEEAKGPMLEPKQFGRHYSAQGLAILVTVVGVSQGHGCSIFYNPRNSALYFTR